MVDFCFSKVEMRSNYHNTDAEDDGSLHSLVVYGQRSGHANIATYGSGISLTHIQSRK